MENKLEYSNLISPEVEGMQEERMEKSLRPQTLDEYIGQTKVKENMRIYIEAAQKRGEPLDHCLFYGPPGLGKTTIANIIANEMKSNIKITSGPAIEKPGDLAAILTTLSEYDVLFIDATKECIKVTNNNKLTEENIDRIVSVFTKREEVKHLAYVAACEEIAENDYNLSVSTYVEPEDTREKIDIVKLNAEIKEIVVREQVLRDEIDKIIAEIEVDA